MCNSASDFPQLSHLFPFPVLFALLILILSFNWNYSCPYICLFPTSYSSGLNIWWCVFLLLFIYYPSPSVLPRFIHAFCFYILNYVLCQISKVAALPILFSFSRVIVRFNGKNLSLLSIWVMWRVGGPKPLQYLFLDILCRLFNSNMGVWHLPSGQNSVFADYSFEIPSPEGW